MQTAAHCATVPFSFYSQGMHAVLAVWRSQGLCLQIIAIPHAIDRLLQIVIQPYNFYVNAFLKSNLSPHFLLLLDGSTNVSKKALRAG